MGGRRLDHLPDRLLLDGGLGTALSSRGLDTHSESTASWNHRRPEAVRAAHQSFIASGVQAIHTNTFTANRWQLEGPAPRGTAAPRASDAAVLAANRAGVHLAQQAKVEGVLVIGDIGPSGQIPPPEGDADLFELEEGFALQASALAASGVDLLHLETLYHPKEARAALRGCRQGAPGVPVVASMACRRTATGYATVLGLPWEGMLLAFLEEGADAVGANCSLPPDEMVPLIKQLATRSRLPVFAQPTVAPTDGPPLYPAEFAAGLLALLRAGARAVGGCCGTSAADLAAARVAIDALPRRASRSRTAPMARA